jgi:hypothetical protein
MQDGLFQIVFSARMVTVLVVFLTCPTGNYMSPSPVIDEATISACYSVIKNTP